MKKFYFISGIIILALVLFVMKKTPSNLDKISVGANTLEVEVATTQVDLAKGLMFRKQLPKNQGMLFVFAEPGRHSFWMKNTLIPLDIIWINQDKEIVEIHAGAMPCEESPCLSYAPEKANAKYVLEVNAGWVSENTVSVGDKVDFGHLPY